LVTGKLGRIDRTSADQMRIVQSGAEQKDLLTAA
jgi:hypothetical protein